MALKHDMAQRIVARFHGDEAAEAAAEHFRRTVQRKQLPDEIPEVRLAGDSEGLGLLAVIAQAGMAKSNSEARRLVAQRAVKLEGEGVTDPAISLSRGGPYLLQVGKRRIANVWID